jgi:hypothetical protein
MSLTGMSLVYRFPPQWLASYSGVVLRSKDTNIKTYLHIYLIQEMNRHHGIRHELFNILVTHQHHVLYRLQGSQNIP